MIAAVLLDAAPEWDRLTAMLTPGSGSAAEFRHRVVEVPFGLEPRRRPAEPETTAVWRLDRLSLPHPGRFEDVLHLAPQIGADADPDRPSWGLTLVDGLTGGQAAFVLRVVRPGRDPDTPTVPAGGSMWSWLRSLPELATTTVRSTAELVAATAADALRFALTAGSSTGADPGRAAPSAAGAARRGGITPHRLHILDIPLAATRQRAAAAGCSLESAIAAAVLLGYATYRQDHGVPVDALFAAIPDTGARPARIPLDADDDGPLGLMRRVDRVTSGGPDEPVPPRTAEFGHDDVLTCSVPGTATPLHVAGAGVERYYGFGPTWGSAFNATLMPYHDTCCIGLSVDPAAVPDRTEFDRCLRAGLHAVLDA